MHLAVLLFSLPRAALNTLWELVVDIVVVPARYLLPDPMPTPIFPELPPIKIPPNLLDPVPYPPIPATSFAQWNATLTFSDGSKPAPTILSAAQLEMSTALLWSVIVTSVFVLITTLIWTYIVARTDDSWKTPPLIAQLYEELTGKAFDASHWERIGGESRPPHSDPPKSDSRPVHPFIEGYPPYDPLEDGSAGDDSTVQDDPPETDWAGCLDSGSVDVFLEALTKLGYKCTSQQKMQPFTHFELHLVKIRAVTSQLSFLVYTSFFTIAAHLVSADKRHKYHLYREENELRACQFVGDYFFRRLKNYDDGDDEDDNDVWREGLSKALIVHPGFGSRGVDMDALLAALAKMTGTSQTVWPKMDSSVESCSKATHDSPTDSVPQVLETTLSGVNKGTGTSTDVKSPDTPSVSLPSGADLPPLPSERSIETTEPAHEALAVEAISEEFIVPQPEPEFVVEVMPVQQQVFIEAGTESLVTPEPEAAVEFMPTEEPIVAEHVPAPAMDVVQDEDISFEATEQEGAPKADPVELGEFDDDLSASMLSNSALEETLVESILDDTEAKTFPPESSHTEGLGLDFGAATPVAEVNSLPTPEDAAPIDLPASSELVQPVEAVVGLPEPAHVAETVAVDYKAPVLPQIIVHSPDERVIAADPPIQTVSTIPTPSESVQPVEVAVVHSEPVSVVETVAVDIELPAVPEVIDHAPQELVTSAEPRTEAVIAAPVLSESVEPVEVIVGPLEPVPVVETAVVDIEHPVVPQVIDHSPEELVAPVDPVETVLATPEPVTSPVVLPEPVVPPVLVPEPIAPSVVLPEPITPPLPEPVTPLLQESVTLPVLPESVALPVLPEVVTQPVQEPTTDVDLYVQESPMSTHSELSASDFDLPTLAASQELSEPLSASEELSDSIVLVDREEPEPICITPPKYNPGMILSPIVEVPEIMTPVASEPPALIASLVEAATERGERMMYKAPQSFFRVYDDGKPLEDAPTKPFTRAGPHPPIGPAVSRPTVS